MKVFVTGGTGLLGCNLIPRLLAQGHSVRALIRSAPKARAILDPEVELVEGDLLDVDSFASSLQRCDALVHAAAYFSAYTQSRENDKLLHKINVRATSALLAAAHAGGVRNAVYVSSAGVLLPDPEGNLNEDNPYDRNSTDPYFQSKIHTEMAIEQFLLAHSKMRVVLVLPSAMLGPGDRGPTPLGKMVISFLKGEMKAILPGSLALADVRDVAEGVVSALDRGESGERFLIGGRTYAFKEIVVNLARVSGLAAPSKQPPLGILIMMAHIMALASKLTGKPPALTVDKIRRLQMELRFDSQKAERVLGVRFRPLAETLKDTVAWFQRQTSDEIPR
jgi:nucleoside-diphosphate-sugar epimerase